MVFALALAVCIRAGAAPLATALGYTLAATVGGGLLYVVMMYAVAPSLNTEITEFTARVPFLIAHLAFGAVTGAFIYWRTTRTATTPLGQPVLGTA